MWPMGLLLPKLHYQIGSIINSHCNVGFLGARLKLMIKVDTSGPKMSFAMEEIVYMYGPNDHKKIMKTCTE